MCLRTGTEDAEASEVEVEQVGAGVDATQGTIELEVVSLITLLETAREHNLEYVASETMGNATTNILAMLVIS